MLAIDTRSNRVVRVVGCDTLLGFLVRLPSGTRDSVPTVYIKLL
jgi:hypothetical protein